VINGGSIEKVGQLVEYVTAAAEQGCSPQTDLLVRIGTLGPEYRIACVKGMRDERGSHLLLELQPTPVGH
jgi:hypothetical protein